MSMLTFFLFHCLTLQAVSLLKKYLTENMQLTVPDTTSSYDAPRKAIPVDHSRGVSAMLDFLGADMSHRTHLNLARIVYINTVCGVLEKLPL